ncbi:MFS transporter [Caulobacter segnis]|uniref:Drug resistance transporter, EmrB/QacA subfamily n=3 Tax=Caulobacter segnis TaxID=88688 RepID=D5VLS6_CAUST|nr:drug resistance transporter, EmrB/QacA subfamily [Caulobacter segnis ATCC 21756]AVQ03112.1 MFS transporter [Caulobacter segnis]
MSSFDRTRPILDAASPSNAQPIDPTIDDPNRRRRILIAVCVALMAVIAAVTGLNVAQPHLALELGASQSQVLWVINIYAISLAALLLPLGAVGDRWGRKPVLLTGLAVFGVASVASGLAPTVGVMLAARGLSGLGAAMIMPVTLSVITSVFPAEERSKAIGVWTGVAGAGGVLGMFLSAVLVDFLTWRWLFALPVMLVLIAFVLALRSVPNSRQVFRHRFDGLGSLLSLLAVMGASYALHEGPAAGWTAAQTLAGLALGLCAFVAFVVWELQQAEPLLDIRLFGRPRLARGAVSLVTWFGVQAGVFVVLYPFFQAVLGWSGLRATLGLMPMALLMMVFSGVAPRLSARIGPRATIASGVLLGGAGLALMSLLVSVNGGYLSVLPGMVTMGVGMGLAMAPSTEAITSSLPQEQQGVASALNDVTRELGTSLGVALLGAVFAAGYGGALTPRLAGFPAEAAVLAGQNIANAMAMVDDGRPYGRALYQIAQEAFVEGWRQSMWAGVAVMAVLLVFVIPRGPAPRAPGQAVRTPPGSNARNLKP